jgi:hypothetical protein
VRLLSYWNARLVLVMETEGVYCEVGTESLHVIQTNCSLQVLLYSIIFTFLPHCQLTLRGTVAQFLRNCSSNRKDGFQIRWSL